MITLNNLVARVNAVTKSKPIFYITADYERALGLEKIIDNYHIITSHNPDLDLIKESNIKVFGINKENVKSTNIIKEKSVLNYMSLNSKNQFYIETFKNSQRFEIFVKQINALLLNDTYTNNIKFERKIDQYNELIKYGVHFPKTEILILGDSNYDVIASNLGSNFVLQFNIGHTGSGTHFINSKQEYYQLQNKFPKRIARVSRVIHGETFTVNGCIYNDKAYFSGLSLQITGITPYAHTKSATIGNDWVYANKIIQNLKNKILTELYKIGNALVVEKYRGLFGVDLIIDGNNEIFIIEINARQPASIPMNTKLQLKEAQIPLSLLHIAEFLGIKEDIDNYKYCEECLFLNKGSQLFVRYGLIKKLKLDNLTTGIYSLSNENKLKKDKDSYNIDDLNDNQFILFNKNKHVYELGDEMARIQRLDPIIESTNQIDEKTSIILANLV